MAKEREEQSEATRPKGVLPGGPAREDRLGAAALATYYHRLMVLGILLLVVLIAFTTWRGWVRARDEQVRQAVHQLQERAIRLKAMLKAADDHVLQLARWAEEFPYHAPDPGASDVRAAVARAMAGAKHGEFNLDALEKLPVERRQGVLNALSSSAQPRPQGPSNLDLAVSLLDRFKYAQGTTSFLRWSYFFSAKKDFLAMAPWAPSAEVLGNEPSIRSFLQQSWTYEITDRARPEKNPSRQHYWTKAYFDQAGAGMMVSLGAPVYWGGEFVGVMGADVLLGFLSDFLREFPDPEGVLAIANEHGQLLADRKGVTTAGPDVQTIDAVLPPDLRPWSKEAALNGLENGRASGDHYVIAVRLGDPDWTVLYLLPRSTVAARAVRDYAPQLGMTALLLICLLVVHRILWRLYVAPALNVAQYVAEESSTASPSAPQVPEHWRPWVDAMVQAFSERRQYLVQLSATNEMLEHRVSERTSELVAANSRLETLAITDPLTGAFNRRHLFDLLEAESKRIQRTGGTMSLLMLDVDYFKRINDTHGHLIGDGVLRTLVERCQEIARATDAVCRYGGEEFAVLLPVTGLEGAEMMGERLRSAVSDEPMAFGDITLRVTVSVGVATYAPPENPASLISRADRMLYAAKGAGRNRVMSSD